MIVAWKIHCTIHSPCTMMERLPASISFTCVMSIRLNHSKLLELHQWLESRSKQQQRKKQQQQQKSHVSMTLRRKRSRLRRREIMRRSDGAEMEMVNLKLYLENRCILAENERLREKASALRRENLALRADLCNKTAAVLPAASSC